MAQQYDEQLVYHKELTFEEYMELYNSGEVDPEKIYFIEDLNSDRELLLKVLDKLNALEEALGLK